MHQITIQEAASHISTVFSNALKGEEIVLTDHDKPVLKIVPVQNSGKKRLQFGSLKGKITMSDDFNETPDDFADYI